MAVKEKRKLPGLEIYSLIKKKMHLQQLKLDMWKSRLQNSPYFWVFKYARVVKQKVWNEAENKERDWGETLKIR